MEKFDKKILLLFIILMGLLVVNIYIYTNKILTPTVNNNNIVKMYEKNKTVIDFEEEVEDETEEETIVEETEEEKILNLKSMDEIERIHKYFAEYLNAVNEEKYDIAYSFLYDEFKQNYFPTQKSFEEYIKSTYPTFFGVSYEDLERQGTYYILTVLIYDASETVISTYSKEKFVIYEQEFGKFVLSFQV